MADDSFKMPGMAQQRHYIKEWRKHQGLNQEQLAERMGVTQSFVSKIERFQQSPDLGFLELAAEVLRCSPADLIERDPSQSARIWAIWDQLQPKQQEQLVEIAQTLKKVG